VRPVQQVQKVRLDRLGLREQRVLPVRQVQRDLPVPKALQVPKVLLARQALLVRLEPLAPQAQPVQRVRPG